ncbi:MAG: leucyl aminopeptidase family protein [Phycisphaerales bacterium]|nr:MAG: leucyl aminopeptidase family protein [Phycisphaerales bacterium]
MFKSIRIGAGRSPLTVVGVFAEELKLPRGLGKKDQATLKAALKTPGFKAEPGEVVPAGENHVLLGLGKKDDLKTETLRNIGAKLVKQLDRMAPKAVRLEVHRSVPRSVAGPEMVGQCLGEGMALGNWKVDFFGGSAAKPDDANPPLSVTCDDAGCKKGLKRGLTLAESVNYARRIAATPPNICNPTWMAGEARKLARSSGLRCKVINFKQAQEMGMGGLVNVGKGSDHKPCLIVLEHKPARVKKGVKLALVGKTLTYDSGGYSLKINNGMKGMKYDKNGGIAVLGTMRAIAALKLPVHVVGLLPAAANMVSGDSYRPDDIIKMYNGVSVEVTNTDAEGRLVLADALAYACKQVKPTALIDTATLTGGVVVALGSWCAGYWCTDDGLKKRLLAASGTSDERLWELPLWSEHKEFMRSKHADIWNSGPKRDGHPIQGAAFLSYFVDEKIPWAHVDIAGVSDVDGDKDLYVVGPTGYGVRLMTELAAEYAK